MGDWADHLTTAFPEVRLKSFLEMRGADGGPWTGSARCRRCGSACSTTTRARCRLGPLQGLDAGRARALRADVPQAALKAKFRGRTVQDLAVQVLEIARAGLKRRARLDSRAATRPASSIPCMRSPRSGRCPAEDKLALYHGRWGGSVDPVFSEFAYWDADPRVPVPVAC